MYGSATKAKQFLIFCRKERPSLDYTKIFFTLLYYCRLLLLCHWIISLSCTMSANKTYTLQGAENWWKHDERLSKRNMISVKEKTSKVVSFFCSSASRISYFIMTKYNFVKYLLAFSPIEIFEKKFFGWWVCCHPLVSIRYGGALEEVNFWVKFFKPAAEIISLSRKTHRVQFCAKELGVVVLP